MIEWNEINEQAKGQACLLHAESIRLLSKDLENGSNSRAPYSAIS